VSSNLLVNLQNMGPRVIAEQEWNFRYVL